MNSNLFRVFGYLLAANGQAVLLIVLAKKVADYLNYNYPTNFDWASIVWPVAFILIAHSFYVIIASLIRSEKRRNHSDKSGKE